MANVSTLGRPADRTRFIVQELRAEIVSGRLAPGRQLPSRNEIEEQFAASSGTVQRALETLRSDGFVVVTGRQGTFVAEKPPHLTNYALVFAADPTFRGAWTRFMTALSNEARVLQQDLGCKINQFYNVGRPRETEDMERLTEEVRAHRLAGIIFATAPNLVMNTQIRDQPGIRRVAICNEDPGPACATVGLDGDSYWDKAIGYLAKSVCKSVALLMPPGLDQAPALAAIAAHGLRIEPEWIQCVDLGMPQYARNITHLLMHSRQTERPDGFVIADDNLVEYASAGLVDAGISVPRELKVVAHCNFPWPAHSVLPVQRLGFDAREVLQECFRVLNGPEPAPESAPIRVKAKYEGELAAQIHGLS